MKRSSFPQKNSPLPRNKSISIERRARSGVLGHAARVAKSDWPRIAAQLDRFTPGTWPTNDLTPSFGSLVARTITLLDQGAISITGRSPQDEASLLRRFAAQLAMHPFAPRTQMEAILDAAFSSGEISARIRDDVMKFANIIYHLNFGAALAVDSGDGAAVSTWLSSATLALLGGSKLLPARHIPMLPTRIGRTALPKLIRALSDPGNAVTLGAVCI